MRITQTHIAETLFADDEMLTFEEVVDILRMEIQYHRRDNTAGVTINIPSMNTKIDYWFAEIELYNTSFINYEWMVRREIVKLLKLESWLNTPIDCSTEEVLYFQPQNFGINVDTMNIDNRNN